MLQIALSTDQPVRMAFESKNGPVPTALVDALVREHQGALLGYARSLVRDETVAQDLVQETFLRLWKKPPEPGAAKAWLFRVCRSRAIDWWRRQRGISPGGSDDTADFFEQQADDTATPAEALVHDETVGVLLQQLAQLPARQQELVRLKFQAGLSYKEIADATGLSVTNVGFILHTALATLRQRMNKAMA